MTTPPPYEPPPGPPTGPPAAVPGNDKTTLWGVLGIVFGICCPLLGILFAVLSMMEAKKVGKPATLAYVGFAVSALAIVLGVVLNVAGALNFNGGVNTSP